MHVEPSYAFNRGDLCVIEAALRVYKQYIEESTIDILPKQSDYYFSRSMDDPYADLKIRVDHVISSAQRELERYKD